jgi:hypothetical protein
VIPRLQAFGRAAFFMGGAKKGSAPSTNDRAPFAQDERKRHGQQFRRALVFPPFNWLCSNEAEEEAAMVIFAGIVVDK